MEDKRPPNGLARLLGTVAETISSIGLVAIAAVMVAQVVARIVFKSGFPWAEELAKYGLIWVVMLTGSVLIRDDDLIKIDFMEEFWPRRLVPYRDFFYRVALIVLLVVLVKEGWLQAVEGQRARITTLNISWFWPYLAIPVGAGLMVVQYILLTLRELRGPRGSSAQRGDGQ